MTVVASVISDIASLGFLVASLVVLVLAMMFRRPITDRLDRGGVKVKRGSTSFELDAAPESPRQPPTVDGEAGTAAIAATPEAAVLLNEDSTETQDIERDEAHEAHPQIDWADVIGAFSEGDADKARRVFAELREGESSDAAKLRADVFFAYLRYRWGHEAEGLRDLEKYEASDVVRATASLWKGNAYLEDGYPDKALEAYDAAIESATSRSDRASAVVGAANSLTALDRSEEAVGRLMTALSAAATDNQRRQYYETLAEIYGKSENWFKQALALEKCVELSPGDQAVRFDAGYAYSEAGREDIAAIHYRAAIEIDPDRGMAYNNLGVAYELLQMPGKAVGRYKAASDRDVTLAMANLAVKHLRQGFTEEARELLKQALALPDPHPNVATHLATLDKNIETENDRLKELTEDGTRKQMLLMKMSSALFVEAPVPQIAGQWQFEDGVGVEIAQSGASFTAQFQRDKAAQYSGTFTNRAIEGQYQIVSVTLGTPPQTAVVNRGAIRGWADDDTIELLIEESGEERRESLSRRGDSGSLDRADPNEAAATAGA